MKKNVGPGIVIAAAVAVIGVIGYFAYQTFFFDPNYTPLQGAAAEKAFAESQQNDATFKRLSAHGGRGH